MSNEPSPLNQAQAHRVHIEHNRSTVHEDPRITPVIADVDVLVVGGGPAGVGAAIAAARSGAKTLLIELHGALGGMWTAGLVNPFFEFEKKGWIVAEVVERLRARNAWRDGVLHTFDQEEMVHLLENMMDEAGSEYWYHILMTDTIVNDGHVAGVLIESKAGREAILAKVTIDCTGDGDVAARAGVPYELGRIEDGLMQPMTLMFEIDGVDASYNQTNPHDLYHEMCHILEQNNLPIELPFGDVDYAPWIIVTPLRSHAVVQATHIYRLNGLNPRDVTKGITEARKQIRQLMQVIPHVKGCEDAHLVRSASTLGIRETRRIRGKYYLDRDDIAAGRVFDDAVTFCTFGVDLHEPAPDSSIKSGHRSPMRPYEIPFRCLQPDGFENLLIAGRCISGSHVAHASYRVTGTCMAMGQAAGLAAAMAVQAKLPISQLSGDDIHKMLMERGVGFLQSMCSA